jgi:TM2 domain-containing membrane protein YozV
VTQGGVLLLLVGLFTGVGVGRFVYGRGGEAFGWEVFCLMHEFLAECFALTMRGD